MSKILLIDGDFILWKTVPISALSETEKMYGVSNEKSLEDIQEHIDWYLENKIFIPTGCKDYLAFLGGKGNFRKEINTGYKENRKDIEYPDYFSEAKQYLIDKYDFHPIDNIEAEDAIGICIDYFPNNIIVREDHDLNQLPGVHYNPTKEKFKEISFKDAQYYKYYQCLTGCTSDKVVGIKGIGDAKAKKLLAGISTDYLLFKVIEEYYKKYKHEGLQKFEENYKLLHILRTLDNLKDAGLEKIIEDKLQFINKQSEDLNFDL